MDDASYNKYLHGFEIVDCSVRNRNILYLVALSRALPRRRSFFYDDRKTRVLVHFANKSADRRWTRVDYEGYMGMRAGATQLPDERFVGVDRAGQVVSIGQGQLLNEDEIPSGLRGPARGGIRATKTIAGKLHACTGNRGLARRDAVGSWSSLCSGLRTSGSSDVGFSDFDSLDGVEFYCVGGSCDAWHFDGTAWNQILLPGRNVGMELTNVCCAADGWIYILAADSRLWKGRRQDWTLIDNGAAVPPVKDLVRFGNQIFASTKHALWEIGEDGCRRVVLAPGICECTGYLAVADGVMLMAGEGGAALNTGQDWQLLVRTRRCADAM